MIVYHDEILNDLRRPSNRRLITAAGPEEEKDKKVGNGRYAIPRGGLFSLVSFPNYLCEWSVPPYIGRADVRFEWASFAVAGGTFMISTPALSSLAGSMPASVYNLIPSTLWPSYLLSPPWMFLLFEISCMLPRAINAHHWYYKTFGDRYPSNRKIVIPYLL
jgi:3-oxo-5-alpha-steroid 4-dehydrogenase 1